MVIPAEHLEQKFEDIQYLQMDVKNDPSQEILSLFDGVIKFIKAANEDEDEPNVLIHCVSGASRSAAFVLAFLISEKGMTVDDALIFCKERRQEVNPKPYFIT